MITEGVDFLMPPDMALQAEAVGVNKARMSAMRTLVLAMLAGAFIALGSVFFTTVTAGSTLPPGITRMVGGVAFSLGLILVIIGGAELFTGNNLIIMAWANKKVSTAAVLRNWLLVFVGNMVGALGVAVLLFFSRQYLFAQGAVGQNMLNIARAKCQLQFGQAVALGILCNVLVCLAVWLCFSVRSSAGKILCIVFPITAFVTCGFEHSIANMYFIPAAIAVKDYGDPALFGLINATPQDYSMVTWSNFLLVNLLPVTLGNIIGGAGLVGMVYWFVYLRKSAPEKAS